MTKKPIDKTKPSNHRCINCAHWPGYDEKAPYKRPFCKVENRECDYWNRCKQFTWNPNKTYLSEEG